MAAKKVAPPAKKTPAVKPVAKKGPPPKIASKKAPPVAPKKVAAPVKKAPVVKPAPTKKAPPVLAKKAAPAKAAKPAAKTPREKKPRATGVSDYRNQRKHTVVKMRRYLEEFKPSEVRAQIKSTSSGVLSAKEFVDYLAHIEKSRPDWKAQNEKAKTAPRKVGRPPKVGALLKPVADAKATLASLSSAPLKKAPPVVAPAVKKAPPVLAKKPPVLLKKVALQASINRPSPERIGAFVVSGKEPHANLVSRHLHWCRSRRLRP